jgi:hypothetical protein
MGKGFESPFVEYKFDSCGHRGGLECGPKAAGTYRIVMIGSSVAWGDGVRQEETFAALLPGYITHQIGRKTEVYNEGNQTVHPHGFALRMGEVFDADPDAILWILTPHDIEAELPPAVVPNTSWRQSSIIGRLRFRIKAIFASKAILETLRELWQDQQWKINRTASATMLLHVLYQSRSQYVKSYLAAEDYSGFLETQPSPKWQSRLRNFEDDAAEIARQSKAAGVPLIVTLVPTRAQAAMISMGEWPSGYNPYKLSDDLKSIVLRHDGIYLDILTDYRDVANPERGYFAVDGHPNADGHATIAKFLAREVSRSAVPALRTGATLQ